MEHFKSRIEDAQKQLDTLRGNVAELMGMAEAEQRDLSESEDLQLKEYADQIEGFEKRVKNLELAEKAMAVKAIEQEAPAIVRGGQMRGKERAPGEIIFKQAAVAFKSFVDRTPIDATAKSMYPTDAGLHAVIKSAIEPAATDVAGWAQELTEEANFGFLDLLRGEYITPQLWAAAGLNLNFESNTALDIPGRAGTDTDMASGFTGERSAIPVRRMTLESQKVYPYKWGAISTFSKELAMRSTPQIQALVQRSILDDTGTKLDNDYLGESAEVTGYRPAGLFYNVTGTPASTGGATAGENMLADLQNLLNPFYAANLNGNIRIIIHPSNALAMSTVLYNGNYLFRDELANGTLHMIPVIVSTNTPIDELRAVVMSAQAVASGAQTFDVSDSATIVEVDDDGVAPAMGAAYPRSPTGAVGGPDGAGTTVPISPVRSLWQTESVAVKMVQYISWKALRAGSVNRITGIDY